MVSVFLTTKSYFSCLVAELSQLCYIGVIRSVALGSTDGLCTWICTYLLGLQPVIVPAGRMFIESHEQYAYTLCYLNALQIFRQPLILLELFHNELFWYATTNIDWLFYTCNLYLGLILKVNLSLAPTIHSFLVNECFMQAILVGF